MTQQEKAEKIIEKLVELGWDCDKKLAPDKLYPSEERPYRIDTRWLPAIMIYRVRGFSDVRINVYQLLLTDKVAKLWFGEEMVCKACGGSGFNRNLLRCNGLFCEGCYFSENPGTVPIKVPSYKFHIARGASNFALIDEYFNFGFKGDPAETKQIREDLLEGLTLKEGNMYELTDMRDTWPSEIYLQFMTWFYGKKSTLNDKGDVLVPAEDVEYFVNEKAVFIS